MLRIGEYSENLKALSQTIIVTNDFAIVLWGTGDGGSGFPLSRE